MTVSEWVMVMDYAICGGNNIWIRHLFGGWWCLKNDCVSVTVKSQRVNSEETTCRARERELCRKYLLVPTASFPLLSHVTLPSSRQWSIIIFGFRSQLCRDESMKMSKLRSSDDCSYWTINHLEPQPLWWRRRCSIKIWFDPICLLWLFDPMHQLMRQYSCQLHSNDRVPSI